ncbi:MAG: hypothetical protein ACOCXJ_04860 [Planctomycetota bacterium]
MHLTQGQQVELGLAADAAVELGAVQQQLFAGQAEQGGVGEAGAA